MPAQLKSFQPESGSKQATRVLISGSIAFDTIMIFDGEFKDHILAEHIERLNVSFLTPRLKREFGGCAANIAYNLNALGGQACLLATIGHDGPSYLDRLKSFGIDTSAVKTINSEFTGQAFITTDTAANQIIAFHPGAMSFAHEVSAKEAATAQPDMRHIGIVGPNGKDAMLTHAREFTENHIPFVFDPGQGLPMFDGAELRALIEQASAITVNDYEGKMLVERTGWSEAELAAKVQALIITRGAQGSDLHVDGKTIQVAAATIDEAVDPTGCGDAFRGGLLHGLCLGWDWLKSAQLGSVLGAIKIEHQGPQNHQLARNQIAQRFEKNYGSKPW